MQPAVPPSLTIVALRHLWWGVSIGGRHYTGEICHGERTIELERRLSVREAKELAEREGRMWLRLERTTNKFDSLEQLERAAVRWCEANLSDPWLLQEYTDCNPERPIAGAGYIKERIPLLRTLARAWAKVPNSGRTSETLAIVDKAWQTIIRET